MAGLSLGSSGLVRGPSYPSPSAMLFSHYREFEDISNASFHLDMW